MMALAGSAWASGPVTEALVLGLATGPVCFASCGPVVVPWLAVQEKGIGKHSRQLGVFLAARLAGYLLFAALIGLMGESLPATWARNSWAMGATRLLIAIALVAYAAGWRPRKLGTPKQALVQIGVPPKHPTRGAVLLGFLTGLSVCPPFLVAGVRAAALGSLPGALVFFTVFFVGTAVWFVPLVLMGYVRRTQGFVMVARMTAALLACWYAFSGLLMLTEMVVYG